MAARSTGLLGVFRSLMPRDERFIERFCEHTKVIVPAAQAFRSLLEGDEHGPGYAQEIARLEDAADAVTRQVVMEIRRTFVTPFDRSQILALITALDDTIDLMKDTSRRVLRYGVEFTPEMRSMGDCIVSATRHLCDGMPLLAAIDSNLEQLHAMSTAIRREEGKADDLLDQGLRTLFAGDGSPGAKLTTEKVYDLIEAIIDRCEDIVDVIDEIIVEQV